MPNGAFDYLGVVTASRLKISPNLHEPEFLGPSTNETDEADVLVGKKQTTLENDYT